MLYLPLTLEANLIRKAKMTNCPRCHNPLGEYPAQSRRADIQNCADCGIEEALIDTLDAKGAKDAEQPALIREIVFLNTLLKRARSRW